MTIHGPDPLHTDEASFVLGQTFIDLQRRIRDDHRDLRPQLAEAGLSQLAKEMLEKGQDALRIRKSKLGVKNLSFLSDFHHIRFLAIEEINRGIESVKHLDQLSHLSLMRFKNLNLMFLNEVSATTESLHGWKTSRGRRRILRQIWKRLVRSNARRASLFRTTTRHLPKSTPVKPETI